ncbi:MAG: cbb3-type cytochrome c oxidase subunit I [Deltaproteobacteria bacterium]|nr:cbb3-type cytochrome c oxidase subunit I [Deltaproteobacteria bacterium]
MTSYAISNPTVNGRPLVETALVKAHIIAALCFFIYGLLAGLVFALQFHNLYPFVGVEELSPGRVRMTHTTAVAYGFLVNGFMAGLHWVVPRLTRRPTLSKNLGWFVFMGWQLSLVVGLLGILAGHAQAIEWAEIPTYVDPFVVVTAAALAANFLPAIWRLGKGGPLYVTLWYFTAGFIWLALTYIMGNYFPQWLIPGSGGAAITGLFIHDLVGLFLTPMGWGLMYYFVPTMLNRPMWSHAVSLIGFWGLAFFYPLNGVHHYLYSTIPMFAQYSAVIATVGVELVVMTVFINFFVTLRGSGSALRDSLPIRWFFVGMIFYMTTCVQCAYQVTLSAQEIIHFTDWVVGHAHLVMFGVFGLWVLGIFTELWPRLVGRPWWSHRALEWHFWLTALGMFFMFVALVAGGLVQGFVQKGLNPWEDYVSMSRPFWGVRIFTGLMILMGQVIFIINMVKTARSPKPVEAAAVRAEGAVAPASSVATGVA